MPYTVRPSKRPDYMSDAEWKHWSICRQYVEYWETRMWHPVMIDDCDNPAERLDWLVERGLQRGDRDSRNDFMHPDRGFYIFRSADHAVEFSLRWAGS